EGCSGMKRKRRKKPHLNHERWLVSYADFITLMFAFFVVLFATAQADKKKEAAVSQAIDQAFRTLGLFQPSKVDPKAKGFAVSTDAAAAPVNIVLGDQLAASPPVRADLERLQHELQGKLSNQIAQHTVALHIGRDGLVISLREAGFYSSGSAVPHPSSMPSLDAIAQTLKASPYDIRIEGHTDNVPIHTAQFDSTGSFRRRGPRRWLGSSLSGRISSRSGSRPPATRSIIPWPATRRWRGAAKTDAWISSYCRTLRLARRRCWSRLR